MKKVILASFMAFAVLTACKDEKKEEAPKTNEELIVGTWVSTFIGAYEVENSSGDTTSTFEFPGAIQTYTFKADGSLTGSAFGSTTTGSYTLDGTNLTIIDDGDTIPGEINVLNESRLEVMSTEADVDFTSYGVFKFDRK